MENKRLTLADFKLNKFESKNEIDKLLGGAAAACHKTCNPQPDATWIDFVDNEKEAANNSTGVFNSASFINNADGTPGFDPNSIKIQ